MKKKRLLSFLLALTMVSSVTAVSSYAETVKQDGLSVTYSTDKEQYSSKDTIKATLTVTNEGKDTVRDIRIDETIPEGYYVSEGSVNNTVSELDKGKTTTFDTVFAPKENESSSNAENESSSTTDSTQFDDTSSHVESVNDGIYAGTNSNTPTKPTSSLVAPQPTPTPIPSPKPEPSNPVAPAPTPAPNPTPSPDNTTNITPKPDSSSVVEKEMKGKPGGGDRSWAYAVAAIAISLTVVAVGRKGKTEKKKMLSIAIAGTTISAVILGLGLRLDIGANAADRSINATTNAIVEGKNVILSATVKYGEISSKPTEDDKLSVAEKYYKENAEIIDVVDVTSETTLSEAEVTKFLADKGFKDYPIIYNYSLSGDFDSDQESDSSSNVKHPMYGTYYISKNNEIWYVTVVGKDIYANPLSYNIQSQLPAATMLSTNDWINGYDDEKDKYFRIIPNNSELIVKKIDDINPETLDKLTIEEVEKL